MQGSACPEALTVSASVCASRSSPMSHIRDVHGHQLAWVNVPAHRAAVARNLHSSEPTPPVRGTGPASLASKTKWGRPTTLTPTWVTAYYPRRVHQKTASFGARAGGVDARRVGRDQRQPSAGGNRSRPASSAAGAGIAARDFAGRDWSTAASADARGGSFIHSTAPASRRPSTARGNRRRAVRASPDSHARTPGGKSVSALSHASGSTMDLVSLLNGGVYTGLPSQPTEVKVGNRIVHYDGLVIENSSPRSHPAFTGGVSVRSPTSHPTTRRPGAASGSGAAPLRVDRYRSRSHSPTWPPPSLVAAEGYAILSDDTPSPRSSWRGQVTRLSSSDNSPRALRARGRSRSRSRSRSSSPRTDARARAQAAAASRLTKPEFEEQQRALLAASAASPRVASPRGTATATTAGPRPRRGAASAASNGAADGAVDASRASGPTPAAAVPATASAVPVVAILPDNGGRLVRAGDEVYFLPPTASAAPVPAVTIATRSAQAGTPSVSQALGSSRVTTATGAAPTVSGPHSMNATASASAGEPSEDHDVAARTAPSSRTAGVEHTPRRPSVATATLPRSHGPSIGVQTGASVVGGASDDGVTAEAQPMLSPSCRPPVVTSTAAQAHRVVPRAAPAAASAQYIQAAAASTAREVPALRPPTVDARARPFAPRQGPASPVRRVTSPRAEVAGRVSVDPRAASPAMAVRCAVAPPATAPARVARSAAYAAAGAAMAVMVSPTDATEPHTTTVRASSPARSPRQAVAARSVADHLSRSSSYRASASRSSAPTAASATATQVSRPRVQLPVRDATPAAGVHRLEARSSSPRLVRSPSMAGTRADTVSTRVTEPKAQPAGRGNGTSEVGATPATSAAGHSDTDDLNEGVDAFVSVDSDSSATSRGQQHDVTNATSRRRTANTKTTTTKPASRRASGSAATGKPSGTRSAAANKRVGRSKSFHPSTSRRKVSPRSALAAQRASKLATERAAKKRTLLPRVATLSHATGPGSVASRASKASKASKSSKVSKATRASTKASKAGKSGTKSGAKRSKLGRVVKAVRAAARVKRLGRAATKRRSQPRPRVDTSARSRPQADARDGRDGGDGAGDADAAASVGAPASLRLAAGVFGVSNLAPARESPTRRSRGSRHRQESPRSDGKRAGMSVAAEAGSDAEGSPRSRASSPRLSVRRYDDEDDAPMSGWASDDGILLSGGDGGDTIDGGDAGEDALFGQVDEAPSPVLRRSRDSRRQMRRSKSVGRLSNRSAASSRASTSRARAGDLRRSRSSVRSTKSVKSMKSVKSKGRRDVGSRRVVDTPRPSPRSSNGSNDSHGLTELEAARLRLEQERAEDDTGDAAADPLAGVVRLGVEDVPGHGEAFWVHHDSRGGGGPDDMPDPHEDVVILDDSEDTVNNPKDDDDMSSEVAQSVRSSTRRRRAEEGKGSGKRKEAPRSILLHRDRSKATSVVSNVSFNVRAEDENDGASTRRGGSTVRGDGDTVLTYFTALTGESEVCSPTAVVYVTLPACVESCVCVCHGPGWRVGRTDSSASG